MTLARELIVKYQLDFPHPGHTEHMVMAFNEVLERAAQECRHERIGAEKMQYTRSWIDSAEACEQRIRALINAQRSEGKK